MRINPAQRVRGRIRLPGDKSISHRAALIGSLATGESLLSNFSDSRDCASTLECLEQLGVEMRRQGNEVSVTGPGGRLNAPSLPLDCGNSGSTMRMIAGLLAGQNFTTTLTGDKSLSSRPMSRIIEPLELMGARILSEDGHAPLRITGRQPLKPMSFELPIASAQVKTCILLAGLLAEGRTEVIEQLETRDHTERMLAWFGVQVERERVKNGGCLTAVTGPAKFDARDVNIPGDFSAAAFFIAAAALLPGSDLVIENVSLNPTRIHFLQTSRAFGADIEITDEHEDCNEPAGTVRIRQSALSESPVIASEQSVAMIDELPLLAVVGTQLPGGLRVRGAAELRVKETDRISATVKNLRAMSAEAEEYDDGFAVAEQRQLKGAIVNSFGDHRIAMAFTIAALIAEGESEILRSECVAVSFPGFFEQLELIVQR
ncbi:MAG TPA: 3-phosphoshikimate 1-carboxyvinyltransferase [Pyrinomonadaceae bacterium]|nr:3-phosphoshikimate 1-carboxyvinyltransferase [Pyrinomonadaceae bacterium]